MKLTNSQEEYLKTIYILENSNKKIRVTDIAKKLNITKPSVNRAIKILKEMNLIEYEAYGDILLTNEGKQYAREILKKQDILKIFLTDILEVTEEVAEEEAKSMKSVISKETSKKLENYIAQIMNLGDLDCNYDENNPKCQNCVKITIKNRLKKQQDKQSN